MDTDYQKGTTRKPLERTMFEVSRASEYFDARQLSTLTGMPQDEFASVCLKELVDNALDACETLGVPPEVGIEVEMDDEHIRLTVSDNGPGIPPEVVKKSLNYSIRVSDKAAYRSPTRGAQGNALKTIIGIPYALGSREPLIVKAQGARHSIAPWVDPAGAVHFDYSSTRENTERAIRQCSRHCCDERLPQRPRHAGLRRRPLVPFVCRLQPARHDLLPG
jgi:hypothetical protein